MIFIILAIIIILLVGVNLYLHFYLTNLFSNLKDFGLDQEELENLIYKRNDHEDYF
jgi:hypothetical protein